MVSDPVSSNGGVGERKTQVNGFNRPIGRIRMIAIHCRHHWIMETAAGQVSKGKRRSCREVREFTNTIETGSGWTPRNKKEK